MAFVSWFKVHPDRDTLQHPLEIWQDSFMPIGSYSFLPVNILYPVAFARDTCLTEMKLLLSQFLLFTSMYIIVDVYLITLFLNNFCVHTQIQTTKLLQLMHTIHYNIIKVHQRTFACIHN